MYVRECVMIGELRLMLILADTHQNKNIMIGKQTHNNTNQSNIGEDGEVMENNIETSM